MDLAVVAALLEKEQLLAAAGLQLPELLGETQIAEYPVPERVDTKASFIKRRGSYTISASGGVQMLPWHIADRTEEVEAVNNVRDDISLDFEQWWLQ